MKKFKQTLYILAMILITMSFSNCSSAQKLQEAAPFKITDVYSQSWVAGIQGGGSGINVFITTSVLNEKIQMEGLYFKEEYVKLEKRQNNLVIGRYKTEANSRKEILLQVDGKEEATKKIKKEKIPFELEKNQAVLVYKQNGKRKYYKIDAIREKPSIALPSANKGQADKLIKQ